MTGRCGSDRAEWYGLPSTMFPSFSLTPHPHLVCQGFCDRGQQPQPFNKVSLNHQERWYIMVYNLRLLCHLQGEANLSVSVTLGTSSLFLDMGG